MPSITIAFSKSSGSKIYEMYESWLLANDASLECVDLSKLPHEEAVQALNGCNGLVLTDGGDVDPDLYDQPEEEDRCQDVDRGRDKFELALIQRARLINIPVFAVGRGMQLLNVFLGGTLVIDLPTDKPDALKHRDEGNEVSHPVTVVEGSLLHQVSGVTSAEVSSSHHQAIDKISWYLLPTAKAADGTIEAVEWSDKTEKPFLLGVQWHPERMSAESPMSGKLAQGFLAAAKKYVAHHRID